MKLPDEVYVALLGAIRLGIVENERLRGVAERLEDIEAEQEYSRNVRLLEEGRQLLINEQHKFS
ncbi:hypothetical protein [Undibacterium umbellatum]|uniref:Uncharacterized protein n=1 Tax=Undibacterium umbellatum TaxID=2762300 RepID=A0ABR6ZI59_9BURK|nr:hypothetical protein [Undibacterium umbellatum]MBC3911407.1 hypothetical protein [Undibacterium umbellatum]